MMLELQGGIHRLFNKLDLIRNARVIIVVAGMEGALASVVGGLVDKPVIGVPNQHWLWGKLSGIIGFVIDAEQLCQRRFGC